MTADHSLAIALVDELEALGARFSFFIDGNDEIGFTWLCEGVARFQRCREILRIGLASDTEFGDVFNVQPPRARDRRCGMSMEHILARYSEQVVKACAEGRGKELLDQAFGEIAVEHANFVFLIIETEIEKEIKAQGSPEISHELFEWAATYPCTSGLQLIDRVESVMVAYNAGVEDISDMVDLVATAYQGQIEKLFDTVRRGGAA